MVEEAKQIFGWCVDNELYEEAMVCLHRIEHLQTRLDENLEDYILFVLRKHIKKLEHLELWDKIAASFQKAFNLFPNCSYVHYELGCFFHRSGNLLMAITEFKEALRLNPDKPEVKLCLENVKSQAVDQWHFRMLNDKNRNACYRAVINEVLAYENNSSVLDIGTGTGILSMMAAEKCNTVYACESSNVMFSICESVLHTNGMSEKIRAYNKSSLNLDIPGDIPEKVSLVITEVFDAGLLGESVLSTLKHAWENLLLPPVCDSDSTQLCGKVIPRSATIFVCLVECAWLRAGHRLITDHFGPIDFSRVTVQLETNEPYNSEYLAQLPGGYKLLSKPLPLCSINFNDPDEINEIMLGRTCERDLSCVENGTVDCVALWFDLELSENLTINTGPESNSCWEQAIFPVTHLMEVQRNDTVVLAMSVQEPIKMVSLYLRGRPSEDETANQCVKLNSEWIRRLNSSHLAWYLQTSLEHETSRGRFHILDHQTIPLAALLATKISGLKCTVSFGIKCTVSNAEVEDKFLELCECLNLPSTGTSFLDSEARNQESSNLYNVMFFNPLQLSGIFRENIFQDVAVLKQNMLTPDCSIYPSSIRLYGMAMDCPSFTNYWKVNNDNVLNFEIASAMNVFQTQYQEDVNFYPEMGRCLTGHVRLMDVNPEDALGHTTVVEELIRPGIFNTFLYWVELVYGESVLNTLQCNNLYSLGAFSPQSELSLEQNEKLQITCSFTCSIPQFSIQSTK